MLKYSDIPSGKKGFIFELDNVLYPEKDYLLQVYYLFANFIEYTEAFPLATDLVGFLKNAYEHKGAEGIFDKAKQAFGIDEKYRENFERLHRTAQLPLKLLLYQEMLNFIQQLVVDRKTLFLVTNGDPERLLNKIKQIDWNGLEQYFTVYFADEVKPKPDTDVLELILGKFNLNRRELVVIGNTSIDLEFANSSGIDYLSTSDLL